MSLANKYRPQTFDQVIDQSHIVDILKYQVEHWQTSQTYLFFGPRGTGKTSTARILSKAINCLNPQGGNPCNQCNNCKTITANKSVDFVEIDAASHTGVDNIREEIVSKASYPPMGLKKKIYLIDEVHMLSKGAFNSLLKIMEETPQYIIFVLATTEIHKVPDTILSRCQIFNFTTMSESDTIKHLEYICTQEWLTYHVDALQLIASISDGCMRDAVKYIDQVSVGGMISTENVTKYIGVANQTMLQQCLDIIQSKDFDSILHIISQVQESGIDLSNYTKQILYYIDQHYQENVNEMSMMAQIFSDIYVQQKYYPNPSLAYKVVLWKYCQWTNLFTWTDLTYLQNKTPWKHIQTTVKKDSDFDEKDHIQSETNLDQLSTTISLSKESTTTPCILSDTDTTANHQDNIHNVLYQATKPSLQKIIWQAGKFIWSDQKDKILLLMIDSGKLSLMSRPETIKYFENLIAQYYGQSYPFEIVYQDPQILLG